MHRFWVKQRASSLGRLIHLWFYSDQRRIQRVNVHFQHWVEIFFGSQIHKYSIRAVIEVEPAVDSEMVVQQGVVHYENVLYGKIDGCAAGDKRPLMVTKIGDGKDKPANAVGQSTSISGIAAGGGSVPVVAKIGVSSDSAVTVGHTVEFVCAKAVKMKHKFPYDSGVCGSRSH